jgi:hypothetical protein
VAYQALALNSTSCSGHGSLFSGLLMSINDSNEKQIVPGN